ncbi:MAG: hypothetical protein QOD24_4067 [Solirubrobacteraceae bacterium]|nr:hypothetical protein [Solirubrobacteraceae bacterium]
MPAPSPWHPRELLRPPPHRGPLIAAGAVLLTAGLALVELRLDLAPGWDLLALGVPALLVLGLGVQAPNEGGRPPAYQSVLIVCGLLLLYAALLQLADALGAGLGGGSPGTYVWTGIVEAVVAGWVAAFRRSAIAALISALAAGIALLEAIEWIFDPSGFAASRWILLVLAGVLVLVSRVFRAGRPRHAALRVDAAALAILAIALQALAGVVLGIVAPFGSVPEHPLPGFWEFVVLAAGCGLVAFGAVDRSPGPAWLGLLNLLAFVALVGQGEATLEWWPLVLLVLGGATLLAGLRPRDPLPPEPGAYRLGEQPLAARTADDDAIVVRVRDDRPASG